MKLSREVEDKLLLKLQLNPTTKIQHLRPIVFSDREPSGETSDWHLFSSGMPMEEDALMDGRTGGRGCGRHRKTIPRYAEYFFLSVRPSESGGLGEEAALTYSAQCSAVLRGYIQTTFKIHNEEGGVEWKEDELVGRCMDLL